MKGHAVKGGYFRRAQIPLKPAHTRTESNDYYSNFYVTKMIQKHANLYKATELVKIACIIHLQLVVHGVMTRNKTEFRKFMGLSILALLI